LNSPHHISVCIATYRRPERLALLLEDLAAQSVLPREVVVVDNDAEGSARTVVDARRAAGVPYVLLYDIQPKRNIALTRNRTVALATGQWLAFVDDDERAPAAWLQQLIEAAGRYHADGLLGPVVPLIPADAPAWIRRGRLYDFPRMPSGCEVPLNRLRFGNALLSAEVLRSEPGPFDVNYGLTTGEDGDMLARLVRKGARILWCDEAIVEEPVEKARLSLRWLLLRAISGGQEFARKSLKGTYGQLGLAARAQLFARAALQLCAATLLAVLCLPAGRHLAAHWLTRAAANIGKLSILWGWHYREYA
jgi:succinoglycan biosynthesis protein ExoM